MAAPRQCHIVSHTHWDREWYLSFDTFRGRLNRVVGRVLDALEQQRDFEHFLLDGQSILLDDHLATCPEDEPRIRALAEAGKLSLGPWYILPDEFLVSAESTVRNLMLGHRAAARFGGAQRVGYMPDSFGHIAQMPQILRSAGLDSFIYTRGNGDEIDSLEWEYLWRAPDGSEVLAVNQCGGYCNAAGLGFEEIWHAHTRRTVDLERAVSKIGDLFDRMAPRAASDVWLINNGCDHFPPQQDFGEVLAALRKAFPETEFHHTGLEPFVDALRASKPTLRRFEGELLGGRLHHILSGVWSARMPLKQANDRCQRLLADLVEPICTYAHFMLGTDYPAAAIEDGWRRLMENHPHDSICGCSIDPVHRQMETRFEGLIDFCEELIRQQLEPMAPTFARRAEDDHATLLAVVSGWPEARREIVERMVVLQPHESSVESMRLVDGSGSVVPFEIVKHQYVERFWGIDYRVELDCETQLEKFGAYEERFASRILRDESRKSDSDSFIVLRFEAGLPAAGHAAFRLTPDASAAIPAPADPVIAGPDTLENSHCRLRLHPDGRIDLLDKQSGQRYAGLNLLESTEDIGDEYDYCHATDSRTVTAEGCAGKVRRLDGGRLRGKLVVEFDLELPSQIETDRNRRSETRVACPLRIEVSLTAGSPRVDVELRFDNRASDHRLRALFPAAVASKTLVSDGQFMIHEREAIRGGGEEWVQPPPNCWPQQEFSLLEGAGRGLALLNRGLPEIEAQCGQDGNCGMALTLLRCVEWLSRDDLETRRMQNAGPTLYTPDAQCPGVQRFSYALIAMNEQIDRSEVARISRRYCIPPQVVQGVEDQALSPTGGLFSKSDDALRVSAIKKHESRDTIVLRLHNPTASPVTTALRFGLDIESAFHLSLLEERGEALPTQDARSLAMTLAPYRIETLEIVPLHRGIGGGAH